MPGSDLSTTPSKLIRFDAVGTPSRRLICLPFAGGGPATYRQWPQRLPGTEVLAVALPGRDPADRRGRPDSIGALADSVSAALDEIDVDRDLPFALFGHSMGALIAFEVTFDAERERRHVPERLFVSGRRPPDEAHDRPPVHGHDDDRFLDAVDRLYGGVPAVVRNEPDLLALLLPSLRADIKALETYDAPAGRIVNCPVHVYGGDRDRHPRPDQLPGWQRAAARPITLRIFQGDHFYLTTPVGHDLISDIADHWRDDDGAEGTG